MTEPQQTPEQKAGEQPQPSGVIIPPAPVIIKRKPNVISIPTMIVNSDMMAEEAKPESEPKYEEAYETRPAATSSVQVGSNYGYRRDPFTRRARFHSGVDIKAAWGDPIGASHAGIVEFAGWYYGYGRLVIIAHGGGVTTYYAHLSSFAVEVGEKVERGSVIGYAGSSGRATSPHLHYELRIDGKHVPPFQPVALDPASEYFTKSQPKVSTPENQNPKEATQEETTRKGAN
ncbi:MAG TPA: M23 family metallopeptidase [Blastocatellia bacterium]|nr:M23 family metallopeptidase [Blastocatellia bacterium]